MERRAFVKKTILGGLVLGAMPWSSVFSATSNVKIIELPESIGHIRHGMLTPSSGTIKNAPAWLTQYRKDVFFKDGIQAGQSDWVHLTLGLAGNSISLGLEEEEIWITSDKGTETLRLTLNEPISLFSDGRFTVSVVRTNKRAAVSDAGKSTFIGALTGSAKINDKVINERTGIITQESSKLEMVPVGLATLITITHA